jgi:hypothetical protein
VPPASIVWAFGSLAGAVWQYLGRYGVDPWVVTVLVIAVLWVMGAIGIQLRRTIPPLLTGHLDRRDDRS